MPNGRPGDHPLTDILVHRLDVFGPEVDEKVRWIANGAGSQFQPLLEALVAGWPWEAHAPAQVWSLSLVLDRLAALAGLEPKV
jgi:hypothetical protein